MALSNHPTLSAARMFFGGDPSVSSDEHWRTMSLKTVERGKTLRNPSHQTRAERRRDIAPSPIHNLSLRTDDISGAKPGTVSSRRAAKFTTRSQYLNTRDIAGAAPRRLIPSDVRKVNTFNISSHDIPGARPQPHHSCRIKRRVNPLNPVYRLPTHVEHPLPQPKFIRDTLTYYDSITRAKRFSQSVPSPSAESGGASIAPRRMLFEKPRDHINYQDVAGSTARASLADSPPRPRPSSLDVRDITRSKRKSRRVTNPLSPRYHYNRPPDVSGSGSGSGTGSERGGGWEIGEVSGSKPKRIPPLRNRMPDRVLETQDINLKHLDHHHRLPRSFPKVRRQFRRTNDISDVSGASPKMKASTFHRSGNRCVNPLDPEY